MLVSRSVRLLAVPVADPDERTVGGEMCAASKRKAEALIDTVGEIPHQRRLLVAHRLHRHVGGTRRGHPQLRARRRPAAPFRHQRHRSVPASTRRDHRHRNRHRLHRHHRPANLNISFAASSAGPHGRSFHRGSPVTATLPVRSRSPAELLVSHRQARGAHTRVDCSASGAEPSAVTAMGSHRTCAARFRRPSVGAVGWWTV
jgi:hypothetical protein